jgi:hypothetical protein
MACHNSKTILHWMPAAWHTTSSSTSTTHGILACDVSCLCWPLRSLGTACHIRNVLASQIFNKSAARYGSILNAEWNLTDSVDKTRWANQNLGFTENTRWPYSSFRQKKGIVQLVNLQVLQNSRNNVLPSHKIKALRRAALMSKLATTTSLFWFFRLHSQIGIWSHAVNSIFSREECDALLQNWWPILGY